MMAKDKTNIADITEKNITMSKKFCRNNVMHACGRNSQFDSLYPSICYAKY